MIRKEIKKYVEDLKSMNLEITSLCNMSKDHCTQCPNDWRAKNFGVTKIDLEVIKRFFKELNELGYTGATGLHSYNEPLMDKRIYHIIELHKEICPKATISILSNGRLMDQSVTEKLLKLGVDRITISAYESSTYNRLFRIFEDLKPKYPDCIFAINRQALDNRMQYYDWPTRAELGLPVIQTCKRVRDQLIVTATGEMQLCCYEWKKEMKFGNINENTLTEILENSTFLTIREDLIKGYRDKYFPCDRCLYG
jgi:radical SAM protein with 4Fe4S-binding SPASM domain